MFDTTSGKNQVGARPDNNKANKNGLDEIDKWAMNIGQSERQLNGFRPRKRHLQTIEI